ncbi:MAG: hypothetical protein ACREON_20460 [Gemmatimonadaceae bacterium]
MRRLMLLALVGCASGSGTGSNPSIEERVVLTDDRLYRSTVDTRVRTTVLPASRDSVWPLLLTAYREMGIEVKTLNPAVGELGNTAFTAHRSLAGKPLSNFRNCGSDAISGPMANTHRIHLSILTTLAPDTAGTAMSTRLRATAQKLGVSSDPLPCSTTGRLEDQLAQRVMALLL